MSNKLIILSEIKPLKVTLLAFFIIGLIVVIASIGFSATSSPRVGDVLGNKQITVFDLDEEGAPIPGTARIEIKYAYVGGRMDESISSQVRNQGQKSELQITEEIVSQRTAHARTFKTDNPETFVTEIISGAPQYYKDANGLWWQANYATIPLKNFENLPKSPSFGQHQLNGPFAFIREFIREVFAATNHPFYPDPGSTVDGYVQHCWATDDWDTCHNATSGTLVDYTVTADDQPYTGIDEGNYCVSRSFYLFDTSSIDDEDVIDSATLSLYWDGVQISNPDNTSVGVIQTNPASTTALTTADYDAITLAFVSDTINLDSYSSGYNVWTLDATGTAAIDKTGISKFGQANSLDVSGIAPLGYNRPKDMQFAETAGTSTDPKLVVVHSFVSAVRKPTNESVTSSEILHLDSEIVLSLEANKTYMIDGVIFAESSTSNNPDIKIAFDFPTGTTMNIGFIAASTAFSHAKMLEGDRAESGRIDITQNTATVIQVSGTVKVSGTAGNLELWWAQATSNAIATTVLEGSYLRAVEL